MKVLLCTDGSAHAQAALDLLRRLPVNEDTEVTVLNVVEDVPFAGDDTIIESEERDALQNIRAAMQRDADGLVAREAERLRATEWAIRAVTQHGPIAQQIIEAAEEFRSDLIVTGALGLSERRRRMRLGSVPRRVLRYAQCSVLVARPTPEEIGSAEALTEAAGRLKLLLAFDGSPSANAAVARLASCSLQDRAELTVLTVLTVATTRYRRDILERMSRTWQEYKQGAQKDLDAAVVALRKAGPNVSGRLLEGGPDASEEILSAASVIGADVVVVGHTGKTRVKQFLLGSVSSELMESAPCSVWVIKD